MIGDEQLPVPSTRWLAPIDEFLLAPTTSN